MSTEKHYRSMGKALKGICEALKDNGESLRGVEYV